MVVKEVFEGIKNDYERYGEVLQMEYFDDWIDDTRYIFKVEGDKLIVYIRDDMEQLEVIFTMDIDFILNSSIEECIREYNECYYYAPNVYIEDIEDINDYTIVIPINEESFIIKDF